MPRFLMDPNKGTSDTLEAPPVAIRPFVVADAPALLDAVLQSLESLCASMTWCVPDYGMPHAQAFVSKAAADWNSGQNYFFAIIDSGDQSFLGSIGVNLIDRAHNIGSLGYWIRKGQEGKGKASAAVRLAAAYAFEKLHLNRLEILVAAGNLPSRRVAEKSGARSIGHLRNRLILNGKVHDAIMYSFACQDFGQSPRVPGTRARP